MIPNRFFLINKDLLSIILTVFLSIIIFFSNNSSLVKNIEMKIIDSTSFLPHGTNKEGNPSRQPVWITKDNDNPNKAEVLVLTDGADPKFFDKFERCVEIFDGNDELAIIAARERWEELQRTGIALTYWEQTRVGSWQKK